MSRILFLGLGAAIMFFGDPQAGRRRRIQLAEGIDTTRRVIEHRRDIVGNVVSDATTRAQGLLADTRKAIDPRLQGPTLGEIARGTIDAWRQPNWSPAQRALAGAVGASATMFGYLRGGVRGMVWCAIGGSLLARATVNRDRAP